MLPEKEEFCLNVASEMAPGRDIFETLSEPIHPTKVLHLVSLEATCDPMIAEDGEPTRLKVELFWRDDIDGEPLDRPIDLVYTECLGEKRYPDLASCLDGTPLVGNGRRRLGIRRQAEGRVGPQHNQVTVRGHVH